MPLWYLEISNPNRFMSAETQDSLTKLIVKIIEKNPKLEEILMHDSGLRAEAAARIIEALAESEITTVNTF